MILRDKVTILRQVQIGTDSQGNAIYDDVPEDVRAQVLPLTSTEPPKLDGSVALTSMKVILPASAADLSNIDSLTWRGKEYAFSGDVLPHTIGGRVHHQEVTVRST